MNNISILLKKNVEKRNYKVLQLVKGNLIILTLRNIFLKKNLFSGVDFNFYRDSYLKYLYKNFTDEKIKIHINERKFIFKFEHTLLHSINTSIFSYRLGKYFNLNDVEIENLVLASLFHDIGKLELDPKILYKETELNQDDFNHIKKHVYYSEKLLKNFDFANEEIITIIKQHHEKLDGTGYPLGLGEKEIVKGARILCVVDIFESMISDRVYRSRFSSKEVFKMMYSGKFGALDFEIVDGLVEIIND